MEGRGPRAEQSEATRAALVAAGRSLFAERGYAGVGTEEIVRRAEVTRGALYHHFEDKKDLFRAVHEELEAELAETIAAQLAAGGEGALDLLQSGARTFLDACTDPALARIALVDAPSVLGWQEWREIDERHGLGLVTAGLEGAMEAGEIPRRPVKPLAHLLLGALGEAGMLIANAEDPAAARVEVEPAVMALLDGLR
ncbi:MAG: TetR/AcrR family transcriptional regulator [Thermoleophilaceae bacterium]|nr:TetR/AcrR family transcriptional regulator [Thermoleophilaceae bacterium]